MRTIKFRGKRADNGEWVYGDLMQFYNNGHRMNSVAICSTQVDEVLTNTVGQFTGLHDKNGKEIYEGDIVSTSNYGKDIEIGNQIKNVSGRQLYEVKMLLCNFVLDSKYRSHYLIYYKDYEVIGNIHDNPELLNK